jgi:hypothetical protein
VKIWTTVTEMKHWQDWLTTRFKLTEKIISKTEDVSIQIIQSEERKRNKENEQSLRDILVTINNIDNDIKRQKKRREREEKNIW